MAILMICVFKFHRIDVLLHLSQLKLSLNLRLFLYEFNLILVQHCGKDCKLRPLR